LSHAEITARTGWRDEIIDEAIRKAAAGGAIVGAEGALISRASFDELKRVALEEVAAHHRREPLSRGLQKEFLRERHFTNVPPEIFRAALTSLEKDGKLVSEKEVLRAREHRRELSDADAELRMRLEKAYRDAGLAAPSIVEAFARAGISPSAQSHGRKILQLLIESGSLVRVDGEMFFHREALDHLITKLRSYADQNSADRAIDVGAFKELTGISRKYAIPLLEYLDRQRVTRREGDRRIVL
jgi:selenocysteine-specific elongation factor